MSGGKDGQILFHRILPATARGLTSKTAVNWHSKVKRYRVQCWSYQIRSIHKLIQQILGSHELNGHTQF